MGFNLLCDFIDIFYANGRKMKSAFAYNLTTGTCSCCARATISIMMGSIVKIVAPPIQGMGDGAITPCPRLTARKFKAISAIKCWGPDYVELRAMQGLVAPVGPLGKIAVGLCCNKAIFHIPPLVNECTASNPWITCQMLTCPSTLFWIDWTI